MSPGGRHWVVVFSHGKESSPGARKIQALAPIARDRGWEVLVPDYTATLDPDQRVSMLLDISAAEGLAGRGVVLVGSSMGAYVSVVASSVIRPAGLFLLAPAVYLRGSGAEQPIPRSERIAVVHGWRDEVVPVDHAIRFCRQHRAELHVLDADHGLGEAIPRLEMLLRDFLIGIEGEADNHQPHRGEKEGMI